MQPPLIAPLGYTLLLPRWPDVFVYPPERFFVQRRVSDGHVQPEVHDPLPRRPPSQSHAALAQRLRHRRERCRRALGERLPGLSRPQPNRIRERPLEPVARRRVGQVVELELVRLADAVRPVGADPEPHHVGDDQQRRVLERQRVLPELLERGVEVGAPSLVFPGEVVALPDVGPAVAARVFTRAALEAVRLAGRVGLDRRRLAQQPAQVDEVLLRGRALLQLGGPPLGDELVRRHAAALARGRRDRTHARVMPPLAPGAALLPPNALQRQRQRDAGATNSLTLVLPPA